MQPETAHKKAIAFRKRHGPIEKMTPKQRRRLKHYLRASHNEQWQAEADEI